eukprot:383450-Lingulodinium_polyedra.AAC.1
MSRTSIPARRAWPVGSCITPATPSPCRSRFRRQGAKGVSEAVCVGSGPPPDKVLRAGLFGIKNSSRVGHSPLPFA